MLKRYPNQKILLVALDFAVLLILCGISEKINSIYFKPIWHSSFFDYIIYLFFVFILIFIFQANGLYKRHLIFTAIKQFTLIEKSLLFSLILIIITQFLLAPLLPIVNKGYYYLLLLLIIFVFFSLHRIFIIRPLFKSKWLKTMTREKVIIIGSGPKAKLLATSFKEEKKFKIDVIGFIDDIIPINQMVYQKIYNIGKLKDIDKTVTSNKIDAIYVAVNDVEQVELLKIIDLCLNTKLQVNIVSDLFSVIDKKRILEKINTIPIVNASKKSDWYATYFKIFNINLSVKKVIDVFLSFILILLLLPMLLLITLIVKLSSNGPAIFKQKRVGLNGKSFICYKFRSMHIGSEKDKDREKKAKEFILGDHQKAGSKKIINETNITKFGKWMRRYSLDELPQLFNIFKGDMSFVGPRPCLPYEWAAYNAWHKTRLEILPGLSGLWQISGRSEVTHNDMVILDIYYKHNLTPWLDLEIILKTIPIMFSGFGGK